MHWLNTVCLVGYYTDTLNEAKIHFIHMKTFFLNLIINKAL